MTFDDPTIKKKVCPVCKREFPANQAVCPTDKSMLMYVQKDELIGTVLNDRYRVLIEVGRGGMSIVYKGVHEMMDRTVAIKMLQSQHVTDQLSIKRFQQEAQAASHLQHPNIITVYDCGVVATGQPYIVMDFLEGESLTDIIKATNHLAYQRVVPIFVLACEALEHAHQKGVIHRDLKSSNIMLVEVEGKKDFVKVVDFGIAKLTNASGKVAQNLTQTGEIFGSPIYMSPEQCLGQNLDSRSDIYSMGAMMYEALTGLPPLMGDTIYATMKMHVSQMPEPFSKARPDLKIPETVERIAFKALAKKPEQRFQTMQEFRDALDQSMRQQFETGSVPSLISAPPMMGYSTTSQPPLRPEDLEDLDLSGGLFGNDPPPVQRTTMSRDSSANQYITENHGQRRTSNLTPTQRGVRPPAAPPESSRKTGVRKPVSDKRQKNEMPAILDTLKRIFPLKVVIGTFVAILIAGGLTALVMYFQSMGNDNPFALEKKYTGVIYYYSPSNVDSRTGTTNPGFIFMRTAPPHPHMLAVNLNEIKIDDYSARENLKDLAIGNRWTVKGDRGPKDTLIMKSGMPQDDSDGQIVPARSLIERFLLMIYGNHGDRSHLRQAFESMMSANWKKPGSADKFKEKFEREPAFRPDFNNATIVPQSMKIAEATSNRMTILLDGSLLFQDNQYYSVNLVFENGAWKIDQFEPISADIWNKPIK